MSSFFWSFVYANAQYKEPEHEEPPKQVKKFPKNILSKKYFPKPNSIQ